MRAKVSMVVFTVGVLAFPVEPVVAGSVGGRVSAESLPSRAAGIKVRPTGGPPVQPLTFKECLKLGGKITQDGTCPPTYSRSKHGGFVSGRFRCKFIGESQAGLCVDEHDTEQ